MWKHLMNPGQSFYSVQLSCKHKEVIMWRSIMVTGLDECNMNFPYAFLIPYLLQGHKVARVISVPLESEYTLCIML
jgi:hypothetical protein